MNKLVPPTQIFNPFRHVCSYILFQILKKFVVTAVKMDAKMRDILNAVNMICFSRERSR